jgi:hypothetical protein
VDDKLAREKVGQALRDAIKMRRPVDQKPTNDDNNSEELPCSTHGIRSLTKKLNEEKNKEPPLSALFGDAKQPQQLQLPQHDDRQIPLLFSNFANRPTFNTQLSIDLEPTPLLQVTNPLIDTSGSNNAHLKSELSASSLLRIYDSRLGAPNNIFEASSDLIRRNFASELYAPRIISGEKFENLQPTYSQQLLPTVIESRRLSNTNIMDSGMGGVSHRNPLFQQSNDDKLSAISWNTMKNEDPTIP